MSEKAFQLERDLQLLVPDRISPADALRQSFTVAEGSRRLDRQPGMVLADEVGMGKTFVALGLAADKHFNDPERRPVVVMVPPALAEKWPRDAEVFKRQCLKGRFQEEFRFPDKPLESGIAFLKTLDDEDDKRRNAVVFVTQGALHRSLSDSWVRLAILRRALLGRHHVEDVRTALSRFAGKLLRMQHYGDEDLWASLLSVDPAHWLTIVNRKKYSTAEPLDDDPVPRHLWEALNDPALKSRLDEIFESLLDIPRKYTGTERFEERFKDLRHSLSDQIDEIWGELKGRLQARLPLLIFDEAHHLKNPQTRLVQSLFQGGQSDANAVQGAFFGVFEKMLFLTATPFQLGHHELMNVLRLFKGVSWERQAQDAMGLEGLNAHLNQLELCLNDAQSEALRLDQAWGRLKHDDLPVGVGLEAWWAGVGLSDEGLTENVLAAKKQAEACRDALKRAETQLRPWVLRHLRPRAFHFNNAVVSRRRDLPGGGIHKESLTSQGLEVSPEAALPFLLAARTVAVAPRSRAVYAEGLASSYEAFLNTHRNRAGLDEDEDLETAGEDPRLKWYSDAIERALKSDREQGTLPGHPKIEATVAKALQLWRQGEKSVVFCHYLETGRALRRGISNGIRRAIHAMARLQWAGDIGDREIEDRLEEHGDRFFDQDGTVRRRFDILARQLVTQVGPSLKADEMETVVEVMRRYVRTPAFLVRYFVLDDKLDAEAVERAFQKTDASGLTLRQIFEHFVRFLAKRCQPREREDYLSALQSLQTGSHRQVKPVEGEVDGTQNDALLPNVRLVNGETQPAARKTLMLTFNTPFYPEVLVASAVLAEGVDLHLHCRHIIHHDLSWNPSTLEQRTGRVDRIGAKVEQCGQPIDVFLPYLAGTQDERMYRVVMDREKWFKVVMGEEVKADAATVDRIASRVPLPVGLAKELSFDLGVYPQIGPVESTAS